MSSFDFFGPVLLMNLLILTYAAPTTLPTIDNRSQGTPDYDSCPSNIAQLEFEIKAVTSGKIKCDYSYLNGTCGNVPIVYTEGKGPHDTLVVYTPDSLEVKTTSGVTIAFLNKENFDALLPMTDIVNVTSNGISIVASLSCQCDYERVLASDVGFYCRIPGKSLLKETNPTPIAFKTERNVFYPLDCRAKCQSNDKCVHATFDYKMKTCLFHGTQSFSASYSEIPVDADKDKIALFGTEQQILSNYATSLENSLSKEHRTFMQFAYDEADRVFHFFFYFQFAYVGDLDESVKTAKAVQIVKRLATSVRNLRKFSDDKMLPGLNGPNTIDHLLTGQEAITSLEVEIAQQKTNQNLAKLKVDLAKIMEGSVDATLARGNFDFKFKVEEFKMMEGKLAGITNLINNTISEIHNKTGNIKASGFIAEVLTTVYVVSKAIATKVGLANIFTTNAGDVSAVLENWRDVQMRLNDLSILIAATTDMVKASGMIHDCLIESEESLIALSGISDIVKDFIDNFKDTKFEKELDEKTSEEFLRRFSNYTPPYNMIKMNEAETLLTASIDVFCQEIFNSLDPFEAGIFQHVCTEVKADIQNLMMLSGAINSIAFDYAKKAQEIVSLYVYVSKNNDLSCLINDTMKAGLEEEGIYKVLLLSANLKLLTLRNEYTMHLVELCNLAEYYAGGSQVPECKYLRDAVSIPTVDEIFNNLQALEKSTASPSYELKLCGQIPTFREQSSNLNNAIILPNLESTGTGTTVFTFPMNKTWLNAHGWNLLSMGLDSGTNYFVRKFKLPLPYASLSPSCGKQYYVDISVIPRYNINTGSGKATQYHTSGSMISFPFIYSDASQNICQGTTATNYMEACSNPGDDKILPDMCIISDGSLTKYHLFDSSPPLPSLFTDFKVEVNTSGDSCVKFPANANIRAEVSRNETSGIIMEELKSTLLTTVCLDLVATAPTNKLLDNTPNSDTCVHCNVGQYHESPISDRYKCQNCPPGTYQDSRGRFSCVKCAVGFYQPHEGQSACIPCPTDKCCNFEGLSKALDKIDSDCK